MLKYFTRTQRYWIIQVTAWTLFNTYYYYDEIWKTGWEYFFLQVAYDDLIGITVTHVYRIYTKRAKLDHLSLSKVALSGITGTILLGLSFSFADTFFYYLFDLSASDEYWGVLGYLEYFLYNIIASAPWFFCYHLYKYAETLGEVQQEKLNAEAQLKFLQLENLQRQLNPHFLFNALNSIKALTLLNPEVAREALNRLSGILRRILNLDKFATITLAEELELVEEYLSLEKIRFEERLSYRIDIPPETLLLKVPPMLIQNLTENAVKHGINKSEENGLIAITSMTSGSQLCISITNTGTFNNKQSGGFGLDSVRKLLRILYGNNASFEIKNENNKVVASVYVPLEV